MSEKSDLNENSSLISFNKHLIGSTAFKELFDGGMLLVEEVAGYLDNEGRTHSRLMQQAESVAYATESMRLTTRLMQLASWLLVQRAVSEGEMTIEQACEERKGVKIDRCSQKISDSNWALLPEKLRELISRSMRLHDKVLHFEQALAATRTIEAPSQHPLEGHLSLLNDAFSK